MSQAETHCRIRPVFMDELRPCVPNRQWRWTESCHLFTDVGNLEELHAVARELGLRREWFQHKPGKLPHYDLNPARYRAAVALGIRIVGRSKIAEAIRLWREFQNSKP